MPVRKIRPSKKYSFRGKEPSFKGMGVVHWESLLELDAVKIFEFDTRVVYFEHQPFRLTYEYRYKSLHYTPDFKVVTRDGDVVIVEVKPAKFLNDPVVQTKLEVGYRYCTQMDWKHRVLTEEQLHVGYLQQNLDLLLDVRGYRLAKDVEHLIVTSVKKMGQCTLRELYEAIQPISEESFYLSLYILLYQQVIYTDLINTLLHSRDSIVRLARLEDCKEYGWL